MSVQHLRSFLKHLSNMKATEQWAYDFQSEILSDTDLDYYLENEDEVGAKQALAGICYRLFREEGVPDPVLESMSRLGVRIGF